MRRHKRAAIVALAGIMTPACTPSASTPLPVKASEASDPGAGRSDADGGERATASDASAGPLPDGGGKPSKVRILPGHPSMRPPPSDEK